MSVTNDIKWEAAKVKELGEQIGYGNMMSLASALWRRALREKYNMTDTGGAFVSCLFQDLRGIAKKHAKANSDLYDELVKDI